MTDLRLNEQQDAVVLAAQAILQDLAQAHEAMGMVKAFSFVQKLATVATLKTLAEIKETKKYKGLSYIDQEGKLATVANWEQPPPRSYVLKRSRIKPRTTLTTQLFQPACVKTALFFIIQMLFFC